MTQKWGGGIDSDMGGGCKYMTERRGDGEGDGDAGQKPHKTAPPSMCFWHLPFPSLIIQIDVNNLFRDCI